MHRLELEVVANRIQCTIRLEVEVVPNPIPCVHMCMLHKVEVVANPIPSRIRLEVEVVANPIPLHWDPTSWQYLSKNKKLMFSTKCVYIMYTYIVALFIYLLYMVFVLFFDRYCQLAAGRI